LTKGAESDFLTGDRGGGWCRKLYPKIPRAYHLQKSTCGKCGYPAKRKRKCMDSVKEQHLSPRGQLLQHPVHLKDFNN
uniref:60S ribosomal protein L37 n=1 Tax=Neovison vison TaxID=452646 RepID=A0A8C7A6A9_NEOVI